MSKTTKPKDTFIEEIDAIKNEPVDIRNEKSDPQPKNFKTLFFEEPEGETIVSGAKFHKWEEHPIFVGQYQCTVMDKNNEDPTRTLGHEFKDHTGQEVLLGDNYAITQALHELKDGTALKDLDPKPWLWIKFMGKVDAKKGEFNTFKIKLIADPTKR